MNRNSPAQRHVVEREVFEVAAPDPTRARELLRVVDGAYATTLARVLDQLCSELGHATTHHRIGRLEIDLGPVDFDDFPRSLLAKLRPALRRALADAIARLDQTRSSGADAADAELQSRLELVATFARTGTLPWWADRRTPHVVRTCLTGAFDVASGAAAELVCELAHEPGAMRRLVSVADDALLASLVRSRRGGGGPDGPAVVVELARWLGDSGALQAVRTSQCRASLWRHVFVAPAHKSWDAHTVIGELLPRVAVDIGVTHRALLAALRARPPVSPGSGAAALVEAADAVGAALLVEVEALQGGREPRPASDAAAQSTEVRELAGGRHALDELLRVVAGTVAPHNTPTRWAELAALVQSTGALHGDGLPAALRATLCNAGAATIARWRTILASPDGAGVPAVLRRALEVALDAATSEDGAELALLPRDVHTGELGRESGHALGDGVIHIANAGLVIVWPFLSTFFARLGLLAPAQRFVDEAARHRAVGLLDRVVAGDRDGDPAEYDVPLNKILCGMPPAEVFEPCRPATDPERVECDALLEAVVARAPSFDVRLLAPFRAAFVAREGVLSMRDGAFLLRVEARANDVVLDELPWSWDWIRLPWMRAPLRVEWL